ncbi:hypothetical protein HKT18_07840 [Flavobacterium sp. IMCC34852]|uniref:Lipocalin-like domain-containing protein n=1 Tax=Flavobacterium rivulicola TaxID=2732161 RepID=A0A7Y3VYW4_9FLAO|nr:hypothetical protein [Flavobacterium sp. IMCC34852]NNT72120.1 hypothetical protein [Flavobacterium sp. IMCC34852]
MKKLILIPALFCLFMLNVASMCSSDDDSSSSSQDPTPVVNTVTQGTWRVTSYVDSGTDETNHFTGYDFTFASGNVLSATNGTNTYTGTWSVTNDSSDDDSPSSDLDFNIAFASPANFADLTDDWDIVTYSANTISLIDISGGNGGTDILVFTKN